MAAAATAAILLPSSAAAGEEGRKREKNIHGKRKDRNHGKDDEKGKNEESARGGKNEEIIRPRKGRECCPVPAAGGKTLRDRLTETDKNSMFISNNDRFKGEKSHCIGVHFSS